MNQQQGVPTPTHIAEQPSDTKTHKKGNSQQVTQEIYSN